MATEQAIEDRVLGIFQSHGELMAEEVFPIYEHLHGSTARSNSIHTTISRLTKKGFLYVVRRQVSPTTNKLVNVWKEFTGTIASSPEIFVPKKTPKQLQDDYKLLEMRYKNLEKANTDLYALIERLRAEIEDLHKDAAGVDL